MKHVFELSDKAMAKIADLNKKDNEFYGWGMNNILQSFTELQTTGSVIVGWRAACGKKGDMTEKTFRLWVKVINVLKKEGVELEIENIPQQNRWTTLAGGAWVENKYTIKKV